MDRRRVVSAIAGGATLLLAGCTSDGSDDESGGDGSDDPDDGSDEPLPEAVDEDGTVDWEQVIEATTAALHDASFETEYRWHGGDDFEEFLHTWADRESRELYYATEEGAGEFEYYVSGDEAHVLADGTYDEDADAAAWSFEEAAESLVDIQPADAIDTLDGYETSVASVTDDGVELSIEGGAAGPLSEMTVSEGTIELADDGRLVSHAATGSADRFDEGSESFTVDLGPVSVPRPEWVDEHA